MATPAKEAIRRSSLLALQRLKSGDSSWFRRSPHLLRESAGLFHAVHFQASQFSANEHATFTVNFIVTWASVYEAWLGRPFPKNPATASFPIQERIGHFMEDRRDHWWDVTPSSDLDALAIEVAEAVSDTAPVFFNRYPSTETIYAELRLTGGLPGLTKPQGSVLSGILASLYGSKAEAGDAFRKAIADSRVKGFNRNIALVAARVGIAL